MSDIPKSVFAAIILGLSGAAAYAEVRRLIKQPKRRREMPDCDAVGDAADAIRDSGFDAGPSDSNDSSASDAGGDSGGDSGGDGGGGDD